MLSIKAFSMRTLIAVILALISFSLEARAQMPLQVSLPTNATGTTGSIVSIPIMVTNTNPAQLIYTYTIVVMFNPNVLEPIQPTTTNSDPAIDTTDTLSRTCSIVIQDTATPGRFNATAINCPILASGTLVKMRFKVIGTAGSATTGTTSLTITRNILENAGGFTLATTLTPGVFTVTSAASSVNISGRVLTPQGRGLNGAQVKLTLADGSIRTVMTSSFGYYRFADVLAGQVVTVQIVSKKYGFQPQTVNLTGNVSDLNFVAAPMAANRKKQF